MGTDYRRLLRERGVDLKALNREYEEREFRALVHAWHCARESNRARFMVEVGLRPDPDAQPAGRPEPIPARLSEPPSPVEESRQANDGGLGTPRPVDRRESH